MTGKKATTAYVKSKEQLIMKNGLLYRQSKQGPIEETVFQFVVPQIHRSAALDGCHHEAAHQGQRHSLSLMQERFWWPGMAHDLFQTGTHPMSGLGRMLPLWEDKGCTLTGESPETNFKILKFCTCTCIDAIVTHEQ